MAKNSKVPPGKRKSSSSTSGGSSGSKMKSNGPINKFSSTLKNDWKMLTGTTNNVFQKGKSVTQSADSLIKGIGRGSYGKGAAKIGGYLAGAAILADFINPFGFGFND